MKALACLVFGTILWTPAIANDGPLWIKPSLPYGGLCGIQSSSDGRFVWVMDEGGLKQFDVKDGRCLRVGPRLDDLSYGDPAQDGNNMVVWDRRAFYWIDATTGVTSKKVVPNYYFYRVVANAAAGVAAIYTNNEYSVVDLVTGRRLYDLSGAPSISPDGRYMLVRNLWGYGLADPRTGVSRFLVPISASIWDWKVLHTDEYLVMTARDAWEIKPWSYQLLHHFAQAAVTASSADGSRLYRVEDRDIVVYSTQTWNEIGRFSAVGIGSGYLTVSRMLEVDGGQTLLVFGRFGGIAIDASTGDPKFPLYETVGSGWLPRSHPVGDLLPVATTDESQVTTMTLRASLTGHTLDRIQWPADAGSYFIDEKGTRIAVCDVSLYGITVLRTSDWTVLSSCRTGTSEVYVSPDLTEYIPKFENLSPIFYVCDITTGLVRGSFTYPYAFPESFAWSLDGKRIVFNTQNIDMFLIDAKSMLSLGRVGIPAGGHRVIQGVSRDGMLVLVSRLNDLYIGDFRNSTFRSVMPWTGYEKVAFAPDGRSYAVSDRDGIRFATVDGSWTGHVAYPSSIVGELRYSSDGARLYYSPGNGALACFRNPIPQQFGR